MCANSDPAVYVQERGDCICLGNNLIELGFSRTHGGALVSVLDKRTGCQLIRDEAAPTSLYRLALRHGQDGPIEWFDSRQAPRLWWDQKDRGDRTTLTLTTYGLADREMKVAVHVTLGTGEERTTWRMDVLGVGDAAVYQLTCPIISGLTRVGDPARGEALAVPVHGEGYLFRNPYPVRDRLPLCAGPGPESPDVGIGRVHLHYPGNLSMQMLAFYNDRAGLYFAAHDAGQHVKEFDMGELADWGPVPVLSMSHFPGEAVGADVAIAYDTIVGVFHGDWYDAADIYKAWATGQWWCRNKLGDRDIAEWMRTGFGVFQMSNYDIPELKLNHAMSQVADVVNELSDQAGVPLLALVFNWEGAGAWTGPKGFFPPREGESAFRDAATRLRNAGNPPFVYMPGGQWYIKIPYDPPFDSWPEFEAEGRAHAVKDEQGEPRINVWTSYGGWESARLCPSEAYTCDLCASIVVGSLNLGCTVVQIDNFPCGGAEACYDPSHDHPPGFGPWWSETWGRVLAETRRQAKAAYPDAAIATEGICENFIPHLDMFDQRAGNMEYFGHYGRGLPAGGETIPLFNYVYNAYIGSYCAAYPECNRPEVLYWTRCLGKALVQGVVPTGGRYFADPPEHNPVTIGFYKKVVRAAAQECWPYIMFGEMRRPPEIDVPTIRASYCKFHFDGRAHHADPHQRHEVEDRAVQHAAFRAPDGTIGLVFVNVSEDPVEFEVELCAYDMGAALCDVERVVDGRREDWLGAVRLPRREHIAIAPLSVVLVEVKAH